ncbi:hypothetical protein ABIA39_009014 [Nocardia sp. GAS34]|uniref:hypothetical protein n=1 Tax=unclassified Nocardia TaxID=2637762 RepID=UPI003D1DF5C7
MFDRDRESRAAGEQIPRTAGTEPQLLHSEGHGHYHQSLHAGPTPVWVRLDAVYIRDPGMPKHRNGAGLDMTGERPGLLSHWLPTYSGGWLGKVTYAIPYADGRPPLEVTGQLIPAYALRPRRTSDHK